MKKTMTVIITLILLLSACGGTPSPSFSEPSIVPLPSKNPEQPLPEYPVIDGSSSTAYMHMAIRSYLTDERFSITHSQTYAALERLIPGHDDPADVVLAVKYYDETLQDVKDRGADLIITPIAKEGFVFLLHKDNPVKSLTQQQIRDIYAGKITNWKEVGGKNADIVPFQRNWFSGSQTAMEDFMGGVPVIAAEETPPWSMSMMLESVYTNPNAIGYNMYSWTMDQNTDVKVLAVDGIPLSDKTLADGSYPLLIYTYSYYNNGNEKGKALTDWLLTDAGQKVIASAGYVGIFGEMPFESGIYYGEDDTAPYRVIEEHLTKNGYELYFLFEQINDQEQIEALSGGKAKDITVAYVIEFDLDKNGYYTQKKFVVISRVKGGEFEIVNEGEWP